MNLTDGTTVSAARSGDDWELRVGDDVVGRIRGTELELGDLRASVVPTGHRWELRDRTGTPVLRFDPAGAKATWLTTSSARYRLARQRWQPLLHRRVLTRDVVSEPVLRVLRGPLGFEVRVQDVQGLHPREVAALVLGAFSETLGIGAVAAAA